MIASTATLSPTSILCFSPAKQPFKSYSKLMHIYLNFINFTFINPILPRSYCVLVLAFNTDKKNYQTKKYNTSLKCSNSYV